MEVSNYADNCRFCGFDLAKYRVEEEAKRVAAIKKAEQERIAAEKKAEQERIAAEEKAKQKRIAAKEKAKQKRIAAEAKRLADLKNLHINRVREIKESAYENVKEIETLVISNTVTRIGRYAFCGCSSLKKVTIPKSVKYIGYRSFYECRGITIYYEGTIDEWCSIDFDGSWCTGYDLFLGNKKVQFLDLINHNSLKKIECGTFSSCYSLLAIRIPNGVTTIGSWAFHDCLNLKLVALPNSLNSIDANSFSDCPKLKEVYFGGNKKQWKKLIRNTIKYYAYHESKIFRSELSTYFKYYFKYRRSATERLRPLAESKIYYRSYVEELFNSNGELIG